jgi:hypothetical protein
VLLSVFGMGSPGPGWTGSKGKTALLVGELSSSRFRFFSSQYIITPPFTHY